MRLFGLISGRLVATVQEVHHEKEEAMGPDSFYMNISYKNFFLKKMVVPS